MSRPKRRGRTALRRHAELIWSAGSLLGLIAAGFAVGMPAEALVGHEVIYALVPVAAGAFFASVLIRGLFGARHGPGEAAAGTNGFARRS